MENKHIFAKKLAMKPTKNSNSTNIFDEQEVDPQIKKDYENIMKGCPNLVSDDWDMIGENFKQFSLYDFYYETKVSNSIII